MIILGPEAVTSDKLTIATTIPHDGRAHLLRPDDLREAGCGLRASEALSWAIEFGAIAGIPGLCEGCRAWVAASPAT